MEKKSMSPMVLDRVEDSPADPPRLEKRGKGRLRLGCFIRVRPSVPGSKSVSEVLKTLNVSRNGLYFGTISSFYFKGMRLFVTYPYSSTAGALNRDYVAEVMRVDQLPNGHYGVAIRFLTTLHLEMNTKNSRS
jgi:hypothetical protein